MVIVNITAPQDSHFQ